MIFKKGSDQEKSRNTIVSAFFVNLEKYWFPFSYEEVEYELRLYAPGDETYRVKTFQYSLRDGANQSVLGPIVFEI